MAEQPLSVNAKLDALPETRRTLLTAIKQLGMASATDLANQLGLTREAMRLQLQLLQELGLVKSETGKVKGAGRPTLLFSLTNEGEHLFPKHYDQLTLTLIDTVQDQLGEEQLVKVLAAISDKQVQQWQKKMQGLTLREKLEALKHFYFQNDPFTEVVDDDTGLWLIEKNCPFLNLANERPPLCSVTVSTLMRLLGVVVKREKRFQDGDGFCAFHIFADQPISANFSFQLETTHS